MKELTIEEKAKRYNELKVKAQQIHNKENDVLILHTIEEMFPELKEFKDENIRDFLVEFIKACGWSEKQFPPKEKCIAWLEKQGDKVSAIEGFETEFERQVSHLIASAINREHEYNEGYVKWTVNALLNFAKHELEKQGEQKPAEWSEEDERERNHCIDFLNHPDMIKATPTIANGCKEWLKSFKERVQPQPKQGEKGTNGNDREIPILESPLTIKHAREVMGIEQKPVEHLELKSGHWYICHRAYCCRADHLTVKEGEKVLCEEDGVIKGFVIKNAEKYFKEIRKPASFENKQKPIIWGEEEDRKLGAAIDLVNATSEVWSKQYQQEYIDWLKSLKERYTWKPSDEQLDLLYDVLNPCDGFNREVLESLYQDLKKLKV